LTETRKPPLWQRGAERIATAVLCGILEDRDDVTSDQAAKWAVECADDLIKWLDKPKEEKT
jgi:hypothetical protein